MNPISTAIAALATLAAASAAQAASFTITGGDPFALDGSYDPGPGAPDVGPGAVVTRNGALSLDAKGAVIFSYMGSEAGYQNQFWAAGARIFDNKSGPNDAVTLKLGPSVAPFDFRTVSPTGLVANGASTGFHQSIALFQTSARTVYALFNDSSTSDKDYDDMVVRMDVAPVPLPAAAWLLVAGLGGLGAVARRRAAA